MKFYDCATAPSPRRVRIYIAEKGLSDRIDTVEINLRESAQMTPEFGAVNPNRTVPVLETDDGARFLSTQGCWRYLEAAFPEPPLMGRTPEEKGRVADLDWWAEMDGFMAVGEALRNSAPRLKDRALVGFSQGTMVSLHVGLRRQKPLAGIIGYSGMLIGAELLATEIKSRPPVLLMHGDADDVLPPENLGLATVALQKASVPVRSEMRPRLGHGLDDRCIIAGMDFLATCFGVPLPDPKPDPKPDPESTSDTNS